MDKYCHSCAAPLGSPEFRGPAENYCKYCVDEKGTLKARGEIKNGLAEWFKSWQPNLDRDQALARAENYMKAMPAWAEPEGGGGGRR